MNKMKTILPVYFIAGTQDIRHLSGDPAQNLLSVLKQALMLWAIRMGRLFLKMVKKPLYFQQNKEKNRTINLLV